MKVVYEIERLTVSGGIQRIMIDKANYMADTLGWDVTIIVLMRGCSESKYAISPCVKVVCLDVKPLDRTRTNILYKVWRGPRMCVDSLLRLYRTLNEMKPNVYVTCQTIGAMSCVLHIPGMKKVYESHLALEYMPHRGLQRWCALKADVIVTLTEKDAKNFSDAKRVVVISNFSLLRAEGAPDYAVKRCVALGRLTKQKNYPRMIEIWKRISEKNPDWTLDIYGEGEERTLIENIINEAGMAGRIVLHGNTDDVVSAMQSASIYLMTSRMEGFPLALVEAMKCGLPIVAFDCDFGPSEVIGNGTTGFLVPYSDDADFVELLQTLMSDEKLRKDMGDTAKKEVERFSCESIMKRWQQLFESIIKT